MLFYLSFILLLGSTVARHTLRFSELDDEDQQLYRAAYDNPTYESPSSPYDTPAYNTNEVDEDDMVLGKLDLFKDTLWALKAKVKELKAFDKALVANLLSTKLKLKEMVKSQLLLPLKTHHHHSEKPSYSYQAPAAPPAYQHYEPQYQAPTQAAPQAYPHYEPQYQAPTPAAPQAHPHYEPQYQAPTQQYTHDPYYGH